MPGEYVQLTVSDNGSGMGRETLDSIFEPFFTTKEIGRGTGLGLATVYGIVRQNDGFINVYSELDQGTVFNIYLPRHLGQAERVETPTGPAMPRGNGEIVLLVEDEAALLKLGKAILERLGYNVLAATTPTEAMRLADAHAGRIDLLVTDVVMPEMNGRELSERLMSLYPGLKYLYMSGYAANMIARQGVFDEGVRFIQKPFSMTDIACKVRLTLDQA